MTAILSNLFSIFLFQTEYISDNLIILANLVLEELIIMLMTPTGFVATISSMIFVEYLLAENIFNEVLCNIRSPQSATYVQGTNKQKSRIYAKNKELNNKKLMNTNLKKIVTTSALVLVVSLLSLGATQVFAFNLLTGQLDYGQTSNNVTNLQTFLASSPSIYPQGLVTGYFGPLTKSAVMNFQNAYGISQVGRVGPQTLAKINSLISSGTALVGAINYANNTIAPTIYLVSTNTSSTSTNVNWTTNENSVAKVYYSPFQFQLAEAVDSYSKPTIIGGTSTTQTTSFQTNHNVALQNLSPHTMYYYIIEVTDSDGNLSYTWPKTFTTSN